MRSVRKLNHLDNTINWTLVVISKHNLQVYCGTWWQVRTCATNKIGKHRCVPIPEDKCNNRAVADTYGDQSRSCTEPVAVSSSTRAGWLRHGKQQAQSKLSKPQKAATFEQQDQMFFLRANFTVHLASTFLVASMVASEELLVRWELWSLGRRCHHQDGWPESRNHGLLLAQQLQWQEGLVMRNHKCTW